MLFRLEDLLADKVVMDELAIKETAQALCDLQKTMKKKTACSSSAAAQSQAVVLQSPRPQQHKTIGSEYKYPSKVDRMLVALAEKKEGGERGEGTTLGNALPTTNIPPSQEQPPLSIDTDTDIKGVCDFVDLTRSAN